MRSLWRKHPPAAPPDVAGHLVQSHANVGRDSRITVKGAVMVVVPAVAAHVRRKPDIVAAEHLPGGLISNRGVDVASRLWTAVIEEPEVHGRHQLVHLTPQTG